MKMVGQRNERDEMWLVCVCVCLYVTQFMRAARTSQKDRELEEKQKMKRGRVDHVGHVTKDGGYLYTAKPLLLSN